MTRNPHWNWTSITAPSVFNVIEELRAMSLEGATAEDCMQAVERVEKWVEEHGAMLRDECWDTGAIDSRSGDRSQRPEHYRILTAFDSWRRLDDMLSIVYQMARLGLQTATNEHKARK